MHIRRYTKALRNIRVTIINKNEEKMTLNIRVFYKLFTFTFTFFKLNITYPHPPKKNKQLLPFVLLSFALNTRRIKNISLVEITNIKIQDNLNKLY